MSEKFCIKRDDCNSDYFRNIRKMRHSTRTCDVTLLSRDNRDISAHKDVLKSGGDYFLSILRFYHEPHPVIKVNEATKDELNLVLDFLYNGKVLVSHEYLETFIKLGHTFKLKGMVDEKYSVDLDDPESKEEEDRHNVDLGLNGENGIKMEWNGKRIRTYHTSGERKDLGKDKYLTKKWKQMLKPSSTSGESQEKKSLEQLKDLCFPVQSINVPQGQTILEKDGRPDYTILYQYYRITKLELRNKSLTLFGKAINSGWYECHVCGRESQRFSHMEEHVQLHMENLEFTCTGTGCGRTFKASSGHRQHLSKRQCPAYGGSRML